MKKNYTVNADELSQITGISTRWLRELSQRGTIPKPTDGLYPFEETFIAWRKSREAKPTPASERKLKAEASILERKDRREAGDTIETEEVHETWERIKAQFRDRALKIPGNIQGISEAQRKVIAGEVADCLRELDKKLTYTEQEEDEQ